MSAIESDPTLTITLDIEQRTVRYGEQTVAVELPDGPRKQFLEGRWDSTAELLKGKDAVVERAKNIPYFNNFA